MAVLCLDFDGVVLESVQVKDDAFWRLFEDEPEGARDRVLALHRATPGMRRPSKMAMLFREVRGREPNEEEVAALVMRFEGLVFETLLLCPMVTGLEVLLERLVGVPLYVVSAAPVAEVRLVAERRGFDRRCRSVLGSPPAKQELLGEVLSRERVPPLHMLYVGDRAPDLAAAREHGIPFLGRVAPGEANPFPPDVSIIRDFAEGAESVARMLGCRWF